MGINIVIKPTFEKQQDILFLHYYKKLRFAQNHRNYILIIIKMEFQIEKINKDEQDLNKLNLLMKSRAQKFGSVYNPMTLGEFKLYKIKRASQTGNIAFLQNILLSDIEDMRLRKKAIQDRTQKFFPEIQVKSEGNFNQKQQPDLSAQDLAIRQNTWYLFGVDYMSNERIRNYFHQNPHFQIEWLNDSACNIIFNSVQQAIQAIKPHRKGDSMTDQNQQIWYQLEDYDVQGIKRKLVCRLATNRDIKKSQIKGQNSEYYKWINNKKKFNNYVKKRATQQMRKTKGIHRPHQKLRVETDKSKKQQQNDSDSSSSGIDSQSPIMKNE